MKKNNKIKKAGVTKRNAIVSEMTDRTTVLLVRPKPPKETIGLQHVMICEPLELEYIAGNLNPKYVKVRIVDLILEKKNIEYFFK